MKEIFQWVSEDGGVHEYRFEDGVCLGFFTNDQETHQEQKYKGRPLTDQWRKNLPVAGFLPLKEITPS